MAVAKKKAATKKKTTRKRRKKVEAASRGLSALEVGAMETPAAVAELAESVESDGGQVLARYREPLDGHWVLLAALPIDRVEPTPFQRDLSDAHVKRLTDVIDKVGRFLDPVIVVRTGEGQYWTPNGNHRLHAMKRLGAKSIVSLLLPDRQLAYQILALNTEKAHNLREKALEVVRMARDLATLSEAHESGYALEFEEPALLTLGLCYEQNGRFAGSVYRPIVKRLDAFQDAPLAETLEARTAQSEKLLALDKAVNAAVKSLKERGFESPYLKSFVVARLNYLRFVKGEMPPMDEALDKMLEKAERFDAGKVKADQVAKTGGPAEE